MSLCYRSFADTVICSAALQPLSGKFYTHLRNKDVFLAHLFLFEIGSLICGIASSSAILIGGRAIAGVGSAGLMNGCLTIIGHAVILDKRPREYNWSDYIRDGALIRNPVYTGILLGGRQKPRRSAVE